MDPRRRTLASTEPQTGSGIPVPSSALKRPAPQTLTRDGHRFSMAPQRTTVGPSEREDVLLFTRPSLRSTNLSVCLCQQQARDNRWP